MQGWGGPLTPRGPSLPVSVECLRPSGRVGDQEVRTCFIFICFCLRSGDKRCPPAPPPPVSRPHGPGRSDGSQEEGYSLGSALPATPSASGWKYTYFSGASPSFLIHLPCGSFSSFVPLSLVTYGSEAGSGPGETLVTIGNEWFPVFVSVKLIPISLPSFLQSQFVRNQCKFL